MDDQQLSRYSRQLLLDEIDLEGQETLNNASIMIVGVGGLGNVAAMALAAAGIGDLHIWDGDEVELSNMPRQPLYDTADIGELKTVAAKTHLRANNPSAKIGTYPKLDNIQDGIAIAQQCDLILDCTDNRSTRLLVNEIAVKAGIPLIAGAAIRFEGQVMTFLNQGGPCYNCLSAQMAIEDVACRDVGILNTQVMLIGMLQAHLALKHLLKIELLKDGHITIMDGKKDQFQSFNIVKSSSCSTCAAKVNTP